MYKGLDNTSKTLIYISAAVSLIFAALGAVLSAYIPSIHALSFFETDTGSFICGIGAGFALTVLRLVLIERMCQNAVEMEPRMGGLYVAAQYAARYIMTGFALFLALCVEQLSFIGMVMGLFSLRLACLFSPMFMRRAG